jgi:hypothetical protein
MGIQAFKRHAELGYLAVGLGLDVPLPGGISLKEWDQFHSLVLNDELCRVVSYSGCTRNLSHIRRDIQAFNGALVVVITSGPLRL